MNIEKLAKHLKEFTLDEIEMIAECNCKIALEHLLNADKIVFEQGIYKYVKKETEEFLIFTYKEANVQDFTMNAAVNYFLKNYVKKHCRKSTYLNYKGIFRFDILPFFKNRYLKRIEINDIKEFYLCCTNRNLSAKRVKNILAFIKPINKILSKSWND